MKKVNITWYDLLTEREKEKYKHLKPKVRKRRRMHRTKKQRQQWFKGLSPEEKKEFFDKKAEEKAALRAEKNKIFRGTPRFNCTKCIHGISESCEEELTEDKVCGWFDNPNDDIKGHNYWQQEKLRRNQELITT